MTSDLPPLSKTHPTLWNNEKCMPSLIVGHSEVIQSCTVDRGELLWALRDTYKRSLTEGAAWSIQVLCGHFGFDFKKDVEDYNE